MLAIIRIQSVCLKNVTSGLLVAMCSFLSSNVSETGFCQEKPKTDKPAPLVIADSYPGDEDFEEANRLKINIDSLDTLKEVISLAESAIKKGLDPVDTMSAKKMIANCYVQKTRESLKVLGQGRLSQARIKSLVKEFVEDLTQAIKYDPINVDAYLMKTELLASRKELEEALEVTNEGIQNLLPTVKKADQETKAKVSKLLMMRAGMRKEPDDVIADLKLSVETNPNNLASMTILKENLIDENRIEEAINFFKTVLESSPENEALICTTAELLTADPKRIDEALLLLTDKLKLVPKSTAMLKTRAKIHAANENADLAKADMDAALQLAQGDVDGLLTRARILLQTQDLDLAKKDVDAALEIDPNRADAVLLRSTIAADQKRFGDAINDLQIIVRAFPKDDPKLKGLLMQLGVYYSQDNRPTQAIKVYDQIIKSDDKYWPAYRLRGDTRLSIGDHANAITDFEKALKFVPADDEDRSGILNNLSWVLSTSPNDTLRDGKRALEYAEEACKLTDFKKPHILSTLAAAHAEIGDFAKAVEVSAKGVELAKEQNEPQLEQLEAELKSYQEKKPWREKTETKENKAPIGAASGVDT